MAITKEFETGAPLYQRGDESSAVFVLKKGSANLIGPSGTHAVKSGDVLGLFDVMLERSYSADAIANTPVTAIILTRQEVQSLQEGGLIYKILQTSLKRADLEMPGRWS
mgnify:FL=1